MNVDDEHTGAALAPKMSAPENILIPDDIHYFMAY
jgi:hypothetical protein